MNKVGRVCYGLLIILWIGEKTKQKTKNQVQERSLWVIPTKKIEVDWRTWVPQSNLSGAFGLATCFIS